MGEVEAGPEHQRGNRDRPRFRFADAGPVAGYGRQQRGQCLPVLGSQKFSHGVKVARRLAREPVGSVRCLEIGACPARVGIAQMRRDLRIGLHVGGRRVP